MPQDVTFDLPFDIPVSEHLEGQSVAPYRSMKAGLGVSVDADVGESLARALAAGG
ncbi:hypothetical protein [Streptomyces soliscabiei]|uniref:hypothetical protein n=1 Tax=Streptomyces soliscabiei TaxID=588897 RepID=UPI0029B3775D|nr:hypothetical protein [Streptomyces sp. NY05-11A]MDX2678534.1 hypothetical protein [Streptomyces sp. NY05-11A]